MSLILEYTLPYMYCKVQRVRIPLSLQGYQCINTLTLLLMGSEQPIYFQIDHISLFKFILVVTSEWLAALFELTYLISVLIDINLIVSALLINYKLDA